MKVLIVESEAKEVRKVNRILRVLDPSIQIVKTVKNMNELLVWLQSHPAPDLVLVEHSLYAQETVKKQLMHAKLVLHTKQYNLTYLAFRAHTFQPKKITSVLPSVKPIPIKELADAEREPASESPLLTPTLNNYKSRFFVEHGQRFLSVPVSDIAYFFSDGRFVYFITFERNKYLIPYRIDDLQQLLDPRDFYRINRSHILSIKSIEQIHPYFGGRFKLKLIPHTEDEILVSRKRANGFKAWLGQ
ncbi:MAG TPA: LytTR family DNA-binding domain-containing protein [Flavisolibacter sp.]|jgi:DNA-binding LytR/AlgR family response regulator|nr:LytTR family DNA-binding domain-containing protein [Flavisolibacter sp.]